MKYLLYYKGSNNPKNKLEAEIYDYLKSGDRLLIQSVDLERQFEAMRYQVQCLNEKFPKSIPVIISFDISYNGDYNIFISKYSPSPPEILLTPTVYV